MGIYSSGNSHRSLIANVCRKLVGITKNDPTYCRSLLQWNVLYYKVMVLLRKSKAANLLTTCMYEWVNIIPSVYINVCIYTKKWCSHHRPCRKSEKQNFNWKPPPSQFMDVLEAITRNNRRLGETILIPNAKWEDLHAAGSNWSLMDIINNHARPMKINWIPAEQHTGKWRKATKTSSPSKMIYKEGIK